MEYKDIKTRMDLIKWIANVSQDEFENAEKLNRLVTEVTERIRVQEMIEADNDPRPEA